jgi:hypothetical protein
MLIIIIPDQPTDQGLLCKMCGEQLFYGWEGEKMKDLTKFLMKQRYVKCGNCGEMYPVQKKDDA